MLDLVLPALLHALCRVSVKMHILLNTNLHFNELPFLSYTFSHQSPHISSYFHISLGNLRQFHIVPLFSVLDLH
jgi:hypothetical protein